MRMRWPTREKVHKAFNERMRMLLHEIHIQQKDSLPFCVPSIPYLCVRIHAPATTSS